MMQPRKIRPPRRLINRDNDFDQSWSFIKQALVDIHNQNAGKLSFEELYRASYKVVLKKRGEELYVLVKEFETKWFNEKVMPRIWEVANANVADIALHNLPGTTITERRAVGEKFLKRIKETWETHNSSMNMVADVLMYLDRGYQVDHKRVSLYTATIGLYRDYVLRTPLPVQPNEPRGPTVFDIFNAVVLDQINMDRDGDIVDRSLLKNCVSMLEVLYETDAEEDDEKLYLTSFQGDFLAKSRDFYRNECQRLLQDGDVRAWLRHTRRRLYEEADRCNTTISPVTMPEIVKLVEEELIKAHLDDFLGLEGSGLRAMIDNHRLEDLSIVYELISRVDQGKKALKQMLSTRVIELGLEIENVLKQTDFSAPPAAAEGPNDGAGRPQTLSSSAQQTAAAIKWVNDILELKEKFDGLWRECFDGDLVIQTALARSFTELFRLCSRSAEYVSLFIDDNFKRGLRGKNDYEVDQALDKATTMIRHLTEKDMFERYYQKHLARRLLHNKSENPEAEKMMIARMQQELGKTFTSKFEGMFKDMSTSEDLTRGYQDYVRGLGDAERGIDLGIGVLSTNNWPPEVMGRQPQPEVGSKGSAKTECTYPREIKRLQESFRKHYLKDRSGRILTWIGSAGSADVKCLFPRIPGHEKGQLSHERRYELNVPTYGMVVLLLFNHVPQDGHLTLEEIEVQTNIPHGDLIRVLASLSIPPKCRVLRKEPDTKTVKQGDKFAFNAHFSSKVLKIRVPVVSAVSKVEPEEERKETEEKNNQTRAMVIDAAIVRIMKQRKELSHSSLTAEVISQLLSRFKPAVPLVKQRIEELIHRDYLERVEDAEKPTYRYMA